MSNLALWPIIGCLTLPTSNHTRTKIHWVRLGDAALLKQRFCDLSLGAPRRTVLQRAILKLYRELEARGIVFRPHVWFAEEWFSPDGIPGIAIPFYLAHPRLERLERRMNKWVDGGNAESLMRILRHEAGHAIDTAYRLRRRKLWRETFGSPRTPYPDRYRVQPLSENFVHHLDNWYAQSHPAEDFAETFAVWLTPGSHWSTRYAGSPALAKLQAMDALMMSIRDQAAPVRSVARVESVSRSTHRLSDYYRRGLARRTGRDYSLLDRAFGRAFGSKPIHGVAHRADSLLRREKSEFVAALVAEAGVDTYVARQLVELGIERCRARHLWLKGPLRECRRLARARLLRAVRLARQGADVGFIM